MTTRSVIVAVAAATLAAGGLIGCGARGQDAPQLAQSDGVPFGLLRRDVTTLVPPQTGSTSPVSLCFIEGERLVIIEQPLSSPVSPIDVVRALSEPPTAGGSSLRTAVNPPSLVRGVRVSAGVSQVDLDPTVASLGGANQLFAIAQIVCSLTARPGIGQVGFTIGTSPVDVPRGDGSLTTNPVSRDDYANLLPS